MTGAGETNRTPDLLITNQLLYQLSYTGMWGASIRGLTQYKQSRVLLRGRFIIGMAYTHDHIHPFHAGALGQRG